MNSSNMLLVLALLPATILSGAAYAEGRSLMDISPSAEAMPAGRDVLRSEAAKKSPSSLTGRRDGALWL